MTAFRKYVAVFESLQREILEGRFCDGRRLPSEAELCLRFKVSRPTAARALRDLQQMGVITRRAGSGSYPVLLGAPAPPKSRTLGLFVPGLGNTEILGPICNEITRFTQSLGSSVLWGDAASPVRSGEDAARLCNQFIEKRVDGVLFAPIESVPERDLWNRHIANEFLRHGIPLVLLDRDIGEFPSRSEFDLIGIDNVAAAIALTEHLISQSRFRICFLAKPHFPSTTNLRQLGCREALRSHGITVNYRLAHIGDPADAQFVSNVLQLSEPDAIVCSNDQTAALLIRSLAQLKRQVPDTIAVAGFDDVHYATLLAPSLTTVRQPCPELGRSAVKALLERIENPELAPRQILHSHEVVIRQSTTRHTQQLSA